MKYSLLITGGAGFIGSHVVKKMVNTYPDYQIINLDFLTYAGNLATLDDIREAPNYQFIKGDINDIQLLNELFTKYEIDGVLHLAAESHVDRSILNPTAFITTNVLGTVTLMNVARNHWDITNKKHRFYHVSTDEVYGSLGPKGLFVETTAYDPKSPYSASKAASDHFVRAFHNTYNLPILISNCSNNYGPYQFPEKLIPVVIEKIKNQSPIPIYGKGENIRDWLYVEDHVEAIDLIFHQGIVGETYNIGGENEWQNIELVYKLCDLLDSRLKRSDQSARSLINFVKDRAGHDQRYAIDIAKIKKELGWVPRTSFEEGLTKTVDWYLNNDAWLQQVKSGDYLKYYEENYLNR